MAPVSSQTLVRDHRTQLPQQFHVCSFKLQRNARRHGAVRHGLCQEVRAGIYLKFTSSLSEGNCSGLGCVPLHPGCGASLLAYTIPALQRSCLKMRTSTNSSRSKRINNVEAMALLSPNRITLPFFRPALKTQSYLSWLQTKIPLFPPPSRSSFLQFRQPIAELIHEMGCQRTENGGTRRRACLFLCVTQQHVQKYR